MIEVDGSPKTQLEIRQKMYENITNECIFISRASEGALTSEWVMEQPIFMRKKLFKSFQKELNERKQRLNKHNRK